MKDKTILIVDDQALIRKMLNLNLTKRTGCKVIEADNGFVAIDKVMKEKIDLILLDLMMPMMDGFKVLEILKQNEETKNIPIIIVSAKNSMKDVMKSYDYAADEYIKKPYNIVDLIKKCKNLLAEYEKK